MTELLIDIPHGAAIERALQRAPQIAGEAQQTILEPLGEAYLLALKRETPKGRGEAAEDGRLIDQYSVEEFFSPYEALVHIANVAPQLQYVIKGRGPVTATNKQALRFVIDGEEYFRKHVGPAEANNFPVRVKSEMQDRVDAAGAAIGARIAQGLEENI